MNAVWMGTAALPSGLIIPWSLEAAAWVRTTSTAQGVYNVVLLNIYKYNSVKAHLFVLGTCEFELKLLKLLRYLCLQRYRKVVLNNCTKGVKEIYTAIKQQCPIRPPKGLLVTTKDGKLTANLGSNVTFLVHLDEVRQNVSVTPLLFCLDRCFPEAMI